MDKQKLRERDICSKFITSAVTAAGWDALLQIREEVSFAKGRIIARVDELLAKWAVWLHSASNGKNASNTPERPRRQNRFHTLFHLPNSPGSARHVMLWTVK